MCAAGPLQRRDFKLQSSVSQNPQQSSELSRNSKLSHSAMIPRFFYSCSPLSLSHRPSNSGQSFTFHVITKLECPSLASSLVFLCTSGRCVVHVVVSASTINTVGLGMELSSYQLGSCQSQKGTVPLFSSQLSYVSSKFPRFCHSDSDLRPECGNVDYHYYTC